MADIGFGQFARRIHADQERRSAFMSAPERPAPADPNARTFGFRSGAAAPLPAPGTPGGSLMGTPPPPAERTWEPTAFKAGAGAPAPAEVIRGSRMTFTNPVAADAGGGYTPQPGRGTQEFATSLEARQAFNQGTGVGEPRLPGQTGQEIAAKAQVEAASAYNKNPALLAQEAAIRQKQEKTERDEAGTNFDRMVSRLHGTPTVGKSGQITHELKDVDQETLRDIDYGREYAVEMKDPRAGQNFMEWSKQLRTRYATQYAWYMQNNPQGWYDKVKEAGPQMPAITYPAGAPAPAAPQPWYRIGPTPGTPTTEMAPGAGFVAP